MKKGSVLAVIFGVILIINLVDLVNLTYAENLNLKINGEINGYSSDVYLKINSNSVSTFDQYDMNAPDNPSNYSQFYSNVSNNKLSIDSWSTNPRTTSLVYSISSAQTGTLTLSWISLSGSDYSGTFSYYGNDSSYTALVGSADMRTSSSYTTNLSGDSNVYMKVLVSDYTAPSSGTGTTSSGGGGGGGTPKAKTEIYIEQTDLEIPIVLNTVKTRTIKLSNNGNSSMKVDVKVQGLEDIIDIKDTSFTLAAGESKDLEIKIISPDKPGIYTGKIIINGKEVLVSVNVNTKELLFDVGIVIPDDFKIIDVGGKLRSQITLIPMGEKARMDVTLNYMIKDFEGRTFFSESETLLIEGQKSFSKEFSTQNLPAGNYVLGLELIYPNGVATSTSHFKIREKETPKKSYYTFILLILGAGIIALILLIISVIVRYKNIAKLKLRKRSK